MNLHLSEEGIRHQNVEAAGIRLHALAAGAGGPTIVLLHGASGNARDFTFGTVQALAHRRRVLFFDRPGFGESEPLAGAESPFVQARAMSAALPRLGLARPILVGHSYGGAVALAWALAEPAALRGLVLLGAPSHLWQGRTGLTNDLLATPLVGHAVAAAAPLAISRAFMEGAAARVFAPQVRAPPPGSSPRRLRPPAISTGSAPTACSDPRPCAATRASSPHSRPISAPWSRATPRCRCRSSSSMARPTRSCPRPSTPNPSPTASRAPG